MFQVQKELKLLKKKVTAQKHKKNKLQTIIDRRRNSKTKNRRQNKYPRRGTRLFPRRSPASR